MQVEGCCGKGVKEGRALNRQQELLNYLLPHNFWRFFPTVSTTEKNLFTLDSTSHSFIIYESLSVEEKQIMFYLCSSLRLITGYLAFEAFSFLLFVRFVKALPITKNVEIYNGVLVGDIKIIFF